MRARVQVRESQTNKIMESLFDWFHAKSYKGKMAYNIGITSSLATLDYFTGFEFGFSLFYVLPISIATWFISSRMGLIYCVLCGVIWGVLDWQSGHSYSNAFYPVWNAMMRTGFYLIVTKLLSMTRMAFEKERLVSRTDFLTGVYNSRFLSEMIDRELEIFKRYQRGFVVAYVDLDHFKKVNDTMGHSEGDKVLKKVAEIMTSCLRKVDMVGRIGGDEFVIVMPETSLDKSQLVLKRMEARLLEEMKTNSWPVTFSIGAISAKKDHKSVDEILRTADALMYQAKTNGKNTIVFEAA